MELTTEQGEPTRLSHGILAVLCAIAIALLGARIFSHVPVSYTLAPIVALACALACRHFADAAMAAAIGICGGVAASMVSGTPILVGQQGWVGTLVQAVVIAAVIAAVVSFLIARAPRTVPAFAATAVLVLLGSMWLAQMAIAYVPVGNGFTPVAALAGTPSVAPGVTDDALFLLAVRRVAAGEGYYRAMLDILQQGNAVGRGSIVFTSPVAFRFPTLYRLYASLPPNGISFIYAFLVLASAGAVAAYLLARRFVVAPVALVGATLVANYLSSHSSWLHLMSTETWAGTLGLVSIALFVGARTSRRFVMPLDVAAAVVAVGAFAFRELAIVFLVIGLAASLSEGPLRRRRVWLLWAAGLILAGVGYGMHVAAVRAAVAHVALSHALSPSVWFDPTGKGLYGSVFLVSEFLALPIVAGWLLTALGVAGSIVASRKRAVRAALGGATIGGVIALALMHPAGESAGGIVPSYWSGLVFPTVLACVPLAFAFVHAVRRAAVGPDNE